MGHFGASNFGTDSSANGPQGNPKSNEYAKLAGII